MRAPRTGPHKRMQRAELFAATKHLDALEERYYYPADEMREAERDRLYKQLRRAEVRLFAAAKAYCLGYRSSVDARLKRLTQRRKAAAQTTMVAA